MAWQRAKVRVGLCLTAFFYKKKLGIVSAECHAAVLAWIEQSNPTGEPCDSLFDCTLDGATRLCKQIFFEGCGKQTTPGLLRRACANTKELREATSVLIEAAALRDHSLMTEMVSGHYEFNGPASN